jgi:hypothetical protein
MSDPFQPAESEWGITLALLRVLADFKYPTVISTKGDLFLRDEYMEVLKRGTFILQISLSSTDDGLLGDVDLGTASPSRRLHAFNELRAEGIPTACRIQPLLPQREADAFNVIDACAATGVRHVAVEHLKLPLEKSWRGTSRLSQVLGLNLEDYYRSRGARRIGREWILPLSQRLERVVSLRNYAHEKGLTFGAADNDLLLLSDGQCCCSGVDLIDDFKSFFNFNYTEAIRQALLTDVIELRALDRMWCPTASVAQFMNSHSRLASSNGIGAGIRDYVLHNWNGSPNGNAPTSLHGVEETGMYDEQGYKIYALSKEVRNLIRGAELY